MPERFSYFDNDGLHAWSETDDDYEVGGKYEKFRDIVRLYDSGDTIPLYFRQMDALARSWLQWRANHLAEGASA
jgi:hypothetical protein